MAMADTNAYERRNTKLRINVARTKAMLDAGYSVSEIAAKLKTSEFIVTRYVDIVKQAERRRKSK